LDFIQLVNIKDLKINPPFWNSKVLLHKLSPNNQSFELMGAQLIPEGCSRDDSRKEILRFQPFNAILSLNHLKFILNDGVKEVE
jgi:hypothetical protein